jgi:hypothetical protein
LVPGTAIAFQLIKSGGGNNVKKMTASTGLKKLKLQRYTFLTIAMPYFPIWLLFIALST